MLNLNCESCGKEIRSTADTCENCQMGFKPCKECGLPMGAKRKYCPHCGGAQRRLPRGCLINIFVVILTIALQFVIYVIVK